jgi:excisionase family DNA binding protein
VSQSTDDGDAAAGAGDEGVRTEGRTMSGPTDIPSLDALVADPGKALTLPPDAARTLLCGLAGVLPLLIAQSSKEAGTADPNTGALLTAAQVAARLNVPKSFVYEAARQKQLESVKLGKYIRFRDAAVKAYQAKYGG